MLNALPRTDHHSFSPRTARKQHRRPIFKSNLHKKKNVSNVLQPQVYLLFVQCIYYSDIIIIHDVAVWRVCRVQRMGNHYNKRIYTYIVIYIYR